MCSPHLNAGGEPSFRFTPSRLLLLSLTAELCKTVVYTRCLCFRFSRPPLGPSTPASIPFPAARRAARGSGEQALLLECASHPSSTKAKALATQTHSVPRGRVLSASQATHDALLFALSGTFFLSTLSLPIPPSLPGLGFPFMAPDSWLGQRPPPPTPRRPSLQSRGSGCRASALVWTSVLCGPPRTRPPSAHLRTWHTQAVNRALEILCLGQKDQYVPRGEQQVM